MPTAHVLGSLHTRLRPPVDDTDSELLQRFRATHEEAAFAELVHRHGPMVYAVCRRILLSSPDAEDAFQATFFVLARKADTIRGSVGAWLHGVAVKVANKARIQALKRTVRNMSAARPEAVHTPTPDSDLRAVLDEELTKLPEELRQVVVTCDLGGKSRSQAAKELGWPEGTVAKRLTKARELLAQRLTRRGISLSASALGVALGEQAMANVPSSLVFETMKLATNVGSVTVQKLAESVMRSIQVGVLKSWAVVGLFTIALTSGGLMMAGGGGGSDPKPEPQKAAVPGKPVMMWKEHNSIYFPRSLPVSVAFSDDSTSLLTGDTNGEVMDVKVPIEQPTYRWTAKVDSTHAAVAYSADRKQVYITTKTGVQMVDAATGKPGEKIETPEGIAIGVFPNKPIREAANMFECKIVVGSPIGYTQKTWISGDAKPNGTSFRRTQRSTIDSALIDSAAVPLAVDQVGELVITTGDLDPKTKKNFLWACRYITNSDGRLVLEGHTATVVSAAWAKEGGTAVTGDADGRVIVWDAKTMKESRRLELGGRVMALAMSDDATHTAAYVAKKDRAEVLVWETATNKPTAIHTKFADFTGTKLHASLAFSHDGKRLAGCAVNKDWLTKLGDLEEKVHVWELSPEPKAQAAPKHLYTETLPKGSSTECVVLDDASFIVPSLKPGGIDYRDLRDGKVLFRLGFGDFTLGKMKLSADRRWLAMEQRTPFDPKKTGLTKTTFDVGVRSVHKWEERLTIADCSELLDVASGGTVVAVVRNKKLEVWDIATKKVLKTADFEFTKCDAAAFSPDGKLLAVFDGSHNLIWWAWNEGKHEMMLRREKVGSLCFSPDGKFLASGPTEWINLSEQISIWNVETRKVQSEFANSKKLSMSTPSMTFTHGGRVLIACDNIKPEKQEDFPSHRITLWDTATGAVAHQLAIPSGLPQKIDVSPNGRYLIATVKDGDDVKLLSWRLDGIVPAVVPGNRPPSAAAPKP
jgi:RNA polymerase sigma factor (sigma-70 family)